MKELLIKRVVAQNYKNFKRIEVDLDAETNVFMGKNGTGKSTLGSLIYDVLFGQDLKGNTRFERIPRVDGKTLVFKGRIKNEEERIYIQLETMINGMKYNLKKEFEPDGTLKTYYINDDKHTKKSFDSVIEEKIGKLELFKICSNPYYFIEKLNKDKQEKLLKQLITVPDDIEIFNSVRSKGYKFSEEFAVHLLGNAKEFIPPMPLEDIVTKFNNKKSKAVADIIKFETAIETLEDEKVELSAGSEDLNLEEIKKEINTIDDQIKNAQSIQKSNEANDEDRKQLENKKMRFETQLAVLETQANINPYSKEVEHLENLATSKKQDKIKIESEHNQKGDEEVRLQNSTPNYTESEEIVTLRLEVDQLEEPTEKTFEYTDPEIDEECFACQHPLDKSDVEAAIEAAKEKQFKQSKEAYILLYNRKVSNLNNKLKGEKIIFEAEETRHTNNLNSVQSTLDKLELDHASVKVDIDNLEKDILKAKENEATYSGENPEIKKMKIDIEACEVELLKVPINVEVTVTSDLLDQKADLQARTGNDEAIKQLGESIVKYTKLVNNNNTEKEVSENVLEDVSKFVEQQFEIVNAIVAKELPTIQIRTVEPKADGLGFKRVFVVLKDGKPYDECSDGEKLVIALELINFFNRKYGVKLPIISDELETVSASIRFKNIQSLLFKVDPLYPDLTQFSSSINGPVNCLYHNELVQSNSITYDFETGGIEYE